MNREGWLFRVRRWIRWHEGTIGVTLLALALLFILVAWSPGEDFRGQWRTTGVNPVIIPGMATIDGERRVLWKTLGDAIIREAHGYIANVNGSLVEIVLTAPAADAPGGHRVAHWRCAVMSFDLLDCRLRNPDGSLDTGIVSFTRVGPAPQRLLP